MYQQRDGDEVRSAAWTVLGEDNLTRMVSPNVERYSKAPNSIRRLWSSVTWPYRNWGFNFNIRNQDYDAEKYVQYSFPEYLSSTDSVLVAMERMLVAHARDLQRRRDWEEELPESLEETPAERWVRKVTLTSQRPARRSTRPAWKKNSCVGIEQPLLSEVLRASGRIIYRLRSGPRCPSKRSFFCSEVLPCIRTGPAGGCTWSPR